jgi:hypothetical protein
MHQPLLDIEINKDGEVSEPTSCDMDTTEILIEHRNRIVSYFEGIKEDIYGDRRSICNVFVFNVLCAVIMIIPYSMVSGMNPNTMAIFMMVQDVLFEITCYLVISYVFLAVSALLLRTTVFTNVIVFLFVLQLSLCTVCCSGWVVCFTIKFDSMIDNLFAPYGGFVAFLDYWLDVMNPEKLRKILGLVPSA